MQFDKKSQWGSRAVQKKREKDEGGGWNQSRVCYQPELAKIGQYEGREQHSEEGKKAHA